MKKLFKKSIACLIAVLMVVSSMPFTAITANAALAYMVTGQYDFTSTISDSTFSNAVEGYSGSSYILKGNAWDRDHGLASNSTNNIFDLKTIYNRYPCVTKATSGQGMTFRYDNGNVEVAAANVGLTGLYMYDGFTYIDNIGSYLGSEGFRISWTEQYFSKNSDSGAGVFSLGTGNNGDVLKWTTNDNKLYAGGSEALSVAPVDGTIYDITLTSGSDKKISVLVKNHSTNDTVINYTTSGTFEPTSLNYLVIGSVNQSLDKLGRFTLSNLTIEKAYDSSDPTAAFKESAQYVKENVESFNGYTGTVTQSADNADTYNPNNFASVPASSVDDKMSNVLYAAGCVNAPYTNSALTKQVAKWGLYKYYVAAGLQYGNMVFLYDGDNDCANIVMSYAYCEADEGGMRNLVPVTGGFELKSNWHSNGKSKDKTYTGNRNWAFGPIGPKLHRMGDNNDNNFYFYNTLYYTGTPTQTITTVSNITWHATVYSSNSSYDRQNGDITFGNTNNTNGTTTVYVVNYKPIKDKISAIKETYKKVKAAGDTAYCADSLGAYYRAVEKVLKLNPNLYSYSTNVSDAVTSVGADIDDLVNNYLTTAITEPTKHTRKTVRENEKAATCTAPGSYDEVVKCSNCNVEISRTPKTTPALGHTEVVDEAVAATCTTTGLTQGKHCSVCNEVLEAQTVVPAKGHSWREDEEVPANCTTTGTNAGKTCTVCGTTEGYGEIPAKGHTPGEAVRENVQDSTCIATGSYDEVVYCSVCRAEISRTQKTIAKKAHDYKSTVTAPTCTERGYTTYTCNACSDEYVDDYVDAKGHTEVIDEAVAATCTETGLTEGKHCSVCNEVLIAQTVVPAKGHTEVEIPAVEATCTTAGSTAGTKCSVCDVIIVEPQTIPAKGHSYKYTYNSNNNDGTHTKACENCGESTIEPCTNELKTEGTTSDTWHCTLCLNEYERAVANMTGLNDAITELEALVNADDAAYKYTASALAAAKEAVANAKTYASSNRYAIKEDVDAQIATVLSAETELTVNGLAKYNVTFTIANDDTQEDNVASYTVSNVPYGETVTFDKEKLNGEDGNPLYVVYKWIKIDSNKKESVVNAVSKDFSVVVKGSATYICHVLNYSASIDGENAKTRVRFIDKSGRTLAISYADLGSPYNLEQGITESNVVAPAIPYYDFTEWKCVSGNVDKVDENELVFRATYTYSDTEANKCQIVGLKGALINGSSSYTGYYDEKVTLTGGTHFAICNESGDKIVADINNNYIYVPHINAGEKLYITVVKTASEEASTAITGYFTQEGAGGTTSNGTKIHRLYINAQYYLPENATAVEAGFVLSRSATDADTLQIGKDKVSKLVSESQGANHEYTMYMGFTTNNHAYVRSYLIYLDKDGISHTVYSDVMRIDYSV